MDFTHPALLFTGHCLCGQVRYEAHGEPLNTSLCHCEDCRRGGGGPYQGWVFFHAEQFHLLSGALRRHAYEGRERSFCAQCGSPITFTDATHPGLIEVTLGSVDQAAALPPNDIHWITDRLPWVPVNPDLPTFAQSGPAPCRGGGSLGSAGQ